MSDDTERPVENAARDMEHEIEELEKHDAQLGEHIDEAKGDLEEMHRITGDDGGDVAGDWRDADGAMGDPDLGQSA